MNRQDFLIFGDKLTIIRPDDIVVIDEEESRLVFYRRAAMGEGQGELKSIGIFTGFSNGMTASDYKKIVKLIGIALLLEVIEDDYFSFCYRFVQPGQTGRV
jgi:hypothetical protein